MDLPQGYASNVASAAAVFQVVNVNVRHCSRRFAASQLVDS